MKVVTEAFNDGYLPKRGILLSNHTQGRGHYFESFDLDPMGRPINLSPLTKNQLGALAQAMSVHQPQKQPFLRPSLIFPASVLLVSHESATVVWYTPGQLRELLFHPNLSIPSGLASVPPLLWVATANRLSLFALNTQERPTADSPLYNAPFFNIHPDGAVCMGTVETDFSEENSLEAFIEGWETHFYNSYFSHLIGEGNIIKGNAVYFWQEQIERPGPFPLDKLIKTNLTLKSLIERHGIC